MIKDDSRRHVIYWLASGCFLIFLMVLIGGITRLTGSGLSMVDWKLIMGSIPPLSEAEWLQTFEAYKQFPEYQIKPSGFSLTDFKKIFFWEYLHRMIGRLIGLVFIIPFAYFIIRKKISGSFVWKLLVLFALGGLQGFIGWYMVKSGLVNEPHVSHLRLALHLLTALITFSYTWWLMLQVIYPHRTTREFPVIRKHLLILLVLVFIQIVYGAFVAGLKSGLFYNTFPMMGDRWIAEGVYAMEPLYLNFIDGVAGVQFIHRWLGIAIILYADYFIYRAFRTDLSPLQKTATIYVFTIILIQVVLGIFTLIYGVPLVIAVLHQVGAFMLLTVLFFALRTIRYGSVESEKF